MQCFVVGFENGVDDIFGGGRSVGGFELGYGTDQVLTRMISSRFEKGAHVDQQFFKSSESILLTRCSPAEPSLYAPVAHRELGQIVTW